MTIKSFIIYLYGMFGGIYYSGLAIADGFPVAIIGVRAGGCPEGVLCPKKPSKPTAVDDGISSGIIGVFPVEIYGNNNTNTTVGNVSSTVNGNNARGDINIGGIQGNARIIDSYNVTVQAGNISTNAEGNSASALINFGGIQSFESNSRPQPRFNQFINPIGSYNTDCYIGNEDFLNNIECYLPLDTIRAMPNIQLGESGTPANSSESTVEKYCSSNEIEARAAADQAYKIAKIHKEPIVVSYAGHGETSGAIIGGGASGCAACGVLAVMGGFIDFGLSSAICYVTALGAAISVVDKDAEIAALRAYEKVHNPLCPK